MTEEEIHKRLRAMAQALTDKGFFAARASVKIHSTHRTEVNVFYQTEEKYSIEKSDIIIKCGDLEEAMSSAEAAALGLKSLVERKRDGFHRSLVDLIEQAREIGIDEDFINPLTAAARKLAGSGIAYQPHAAE